MLFDRPIDNILAQPFGELNHPIIGKIKVNWQGGGPSKTEARQVGIQSFCLPVLLVQTKHTYSDHGSNSGHPLNIISSLTDYFKFLETLPDAVLLVNSTGKIALANSAANDLFNYGPAELQDQSIQSLVPESKRESHAREMAGYVRDPKRRPMGTVMNLSGRRKDGSEFIVDIMLSPLEMGGATFTVCVVRDMTPVKNIQDALSKALERETELALADPLTGAPNRRFFYNLAQREIERSRRYKNPFTIAYLDIDNFKTVNDQFGHQVGDEVLGMVVKYAQGQLRKTDLFARLGGDEFGFLFVDTGPEAAERVFAGVQQNLFAKMQENGWPLTFSIGVITCIAPPRTIDDIVKMADDSMYAVKRQGKNGIKYSVFAG
jgi:diguanylate cyclase (GGDEF)-like protein/PAS domain S-box-containing protein